LNPDQDIFMTFKTSLSENKWCKGYRSKHSGKSWPVLNFNFTSRSESIVVKTLITFCGALSTKF
jgi:hypothetical protein